MTRTRPARRPPERPVRRRQDRRREAVRGPRLHRRRQPAGRAAARPRRARRRTTRAVRQGRDRPRRPGRRRAEWPSRAMRGALEGRGIRPQVFFLEARDEVLIRRFSETRHRHPLGRPARHRQLDRRGAAPARPGPRRGGRRHRHDRPVAARAARADLRPPRRRSEPDRLAIQLISFGFKFGVPLEADLVFDVRFIQNPYYVAGAARALRADRRRSATYVLAQPVAGGSSSSLQRLPRRSPSRPTSPRARRRLDDRHRLHGRLPPLDRHGRGARALAARAGLRAGRGLPPRARACLTARAMRAPRVDRAEPAPLAHAGHRRQALAASSCSPASLLLALGAAHVIRQVTRDIQPGGIAQVVLDLVTLQFLPFPLRGLVVGVARARARRARRVPRCPGPHGALPVDDAERPLVERDLPEAVPGPRAADRRDRRRDGPVDAPARAEGAHEQPHRGRRRSPTTAARRGVLREELGIPPVGDIRQLHRRARRRRAAHERAAPVPVPGLHRRGDAGERPGALGGHAVGNLLLAAMTAIEGGDFEEGVRRMNRVLAVRGQVVPASPTPAQPPRPSSRRDRRRRPVGDRARAPAIERVWITPGGRAASEDAIAAIAEAELDRARAGQPVHEPPAEPPPPRDPGCGRRVAGAARLRLQRRHAGGRDDRATTWPTTSRRSSPTRPRASSMSSSRTTASAREGAGRLAAPRRSGSAGRRRSPPRRSSSSTTSSTRPTPTTTIPRGSPRPSSGLRARGRQPATLRRRPVAPRGAPGVDVLRR